MSRPSRGQIVVIAAAVVAFGVLTVSVAYLQLGYDGDRAAAKDRADYQPIDGVERTLSIALTDVTHDAPMDGWPNASAAAWSVLNRTEPARREIRRTGAVTHLAVNETEAKRFAAARCPDGPTQRFGECEAVNGVVTQYRRSGPVVIGLAVDVSRVDGKRRTTVTLLVRPVDGATVPQRSARRRTA